MNQPSNPHLLAPDGWKEKGPGALDWLLRTNLPLMQAVRHHRAGDAAVRRAAAVDAAAVHAAAGAAEEAA